MRDWIIEAWRTMDLAEAISAILAIGFLVFFFAVVVLAGIMGGPLFSLAILAPPALIGYLVYRSEH